MQMQANRERNGVPRGAEAQSINDRAKRGSQQNGSVLAGQPCHTVPHLKQGVSDDVGIPRILQFYRLVSPDSVPLSPRENAERDVKVPEDLYALRPPTPRGALKHHQPIRQDEKMSRRKHAKLRDSVR